MSDTNDALPDNADSALARVAAERDALARRMETAAVNIAEAQRERDAALSRAATAEAARDRAMGDSATAAYNASAFRGQRDEVVAALAALLADVDTLTLNDPTNYEVATAVGLSAGVARQLVERYRRAANLAVPLDAP